MLFKRWQQHDCEQERRFDVHRNRAVVHFGVVWQCPDCRAFWYRQIEYINGFTRLMELRLTGKDPTWQRLTKTQVRKLRQLVDLGVGQLELSQHMDFHPSLRYNHPVEPFEKVDIEKYNQDPNDWVFDS